MKREELREYAEKNKGHSARARAILSLLADLEAAERLLKQQRKSWSAEVERLTDERDLAQEGEAADRRQIHIVTARAEAAEAAMDRIALEKTRCRDNLKKAQRDCGQALFDLQVAEARALELEAERDTLLAACAVKDEALKFGDCCMTDSEWDLKHIKVLESALSTTPEVLAADVQEDCGSGGMAESGKDPKVGQIRQTDGES